MALDKRDIVCPDCNLKEVANNMATLFFVYTYISLYIHEHHSLSRDRSYHIGKSDRNFK